MSLGQLSLPDESDEANTANRATNADYQMLHLAGRGAYGSVWVARDCTGVLLAVKIVQPRQLPGSDQAEREERALALIRQRIPRHPHLVSIFHVSRQNDRLLYAMELADPAPGSPPPDQDSYQADTLARRIAATGRLLVPEAIRIALEILSALETLHEAGLVHRDVKPGNVIFVGGIAKLADIGLATVVESQMSLAGTAGYVPLDGSTGPDADLYALGKLLYQAVTGLEPAAFPTLPAQLLVGPDARTIRRLNRVLLRACAPARAERFRAAAELRVALQAVLRPARLSHNQTVWAAVVLLLLLISGLLLLGTGEFVPSASQDERRPLSAVSVFFQPGDDARLAQNELARQLGLSRIVVNSIGMPLVLIPPGEFLMGSPETEVGRQPSELQHRVRITRPFYLGVYEVTQQEYQQVMGNNPSRFPVPRQPVEQVTWDEAVAFCVKLSRQEGHRYRLPTEAEWEYACRAGTTTRTYLGQSIGLQDANIRGGQPLIVGLYPPNPFGLHDMIGNVWEWCADWFADDYYQNSPLADPTGPSQGKWRVLRGAGWFDGPGTKEKTDLRLRSAFRGGFNLPTTRNNRFGFRVLREIAPLSASRE